MNDPSLPKKSTQYTVESRSGATTEAALQNRTWVTNTGPLVLDPQHLMYAAMSQRCHSGNSSIGAVQGQHQGFYTTGVSDCSVVAIVELGGGPYYFEHVIGSNVTDEIIKAASDVFTTGAFDAYAVVAQYYGGTAFNSAAVLFDLLCVPEENQIYYRSNKSGMSFGVNFVDGTFGEIDV